MGEPGAQRAEGECRRGTGRVTERRRGATGGAEGRIQEVMADRQRWVWGYRGPTTPRGWGGSLDGRRRKR